jgi:uncharacterized protein YjcR
MALSDDYPITRHGYPEEFRELVRQIVANSDKPRNQLAKELGIGLNTIAAWCGREGNNKVLGREAEQRFNRNIDDVRQLHWEGYTYVYIAKQVGLPVSTVWDWINRDHHLGEK